MRGARLHISFYLLKAMLSDMVEAMKAMKTASKCYGPSRDPDKFVMAIQCSTICCVYSVCGFLHCASATSRLLSTIRLRARARKRNQEPGAGLKGALEWQRIAQHAPCARARRKDRVELKNSSNFLSSSWRWRAPAITAIPEKGSDGPAGGYKGSLCWARVSPCLTALKPADHPLKLRVRR